MAGRRALGPVLATRGRGGEDVLRPQPLSDAPSEIRPSATLILAAKDDCGAGESKGEEDYKVLFLQRSTTGTFRGAHVFPGGATEKEDDPAKWPQLCAGTMTRDDVDIHRICAIRETFEECGVLVTQPTSEESGVSQQVLKAARQDVQRDAASFCRLCLSHNLVPDVQRLVYFSRWITPAQQPRRFDTHFFLFASPSPLSRFHSALLSADGAEAVKVEWFRPSEALRARGEGSIDLWPPQFHAVTELARYAPLHADLERVFRSREVVPFLPELSREGDITFSALPGDEAHSSSRGTAKPGDRNRLYTRLDHGKIIPYRFEDNIHRSSKI